MIYLLNIYSKRDNETSPSGCMIELFYLHLSVRAYSMPNESREKINAFQYSWFDILLLHVNLFYLSLSVINYKVHYSC